MAINSSNLILTIGTNPLPIFVITKYFIEYEEIPKKIWFIYTEQTKKYADSIKILLKRDGIEFEFCQLSSESSSYQIQKEFKERVIDKISEAEPIHFNYTGGTKTMSLQIYKELASHLSVRSSYSYLNARDYKIYLDEKQEPYSADLREKIKPKIKDLLDLHKYRVINEEKRISPEIFIKFIENVDSSLRDYDSKSLEKKFELLKNAFKVKLHNKEIIKDKNELKRIDNYANIKYFIDSLPDDYKPFTQQGDPNRELDSDKFLYIRDLLLGKWLELYVWFVLVKYLTIKKENVQVNYEIRDPDWKSDKFNDGSFRLKFELDVIFLNGYQLFAISCTTANERKICKSKGFEILKRAKQIAGDEAKSILITSMSRQEASSLQDELENDTGNTGDILVLGKDDWKSSELQKKIKKFMG